MRTQAASSLVSASNRRIAAVRRLSSLISLFASQLSIASSPSLHSAAVALIDRVVDGRYGDGASRWLELVSMCCLYIAHRQQQQQRERQRRLISVDSMASMLQVAPSVLMRLLRTIQRQLSLSLKPLSSCDHIDHLIAGVDWREQGGAQGQQRSEDATLPMVATRKQQVRLKAEQVLEVMRRQEAQPAGQPPSVQCAAVVYLILLCHPYASYHMHNIQHDKRSSRISLLRCLSSRAAVSARTIRTSQQLIQQQLLDLISRWIPQSESAPSIQLVLHQMDILLLLLPLPQQQPENGTQISLRVMFDGEDVHDDQFDAVGRTGSGDDDVAEHCRTEAEMEDWRRLSQLHPL
jgi:transcription initiation factor TFIIIB Brf1 subunit/transcription initiation factor TFIIB